MSQMYPAISRSKKSKSNRELLEQLKENSLNWNDVESEDGYKLPSTLDPHSWCGNCLLYTSPSPRDRTRSRMPSSA